MCLGDVEKTPIRTVKTAVRDQMKAPCIGEAALSRSINEGNEDPTGKDGFSSGEQKVCPGCLKPDILC